jgi:hypothetical protein
MDGIWTDAFENSTRQSEISTFGGSREFRKYQIKEIGIGQSSARHGS